MFKINTKTQLAKNLLLLLVADNAENRGGRGDCENRMV